MSFQDYQNLIVFNKFTITQSLYNYLYRNFDTKNHITENKLNPGINTIKKQTLCKHKLLKRTKRKFNYHFGDANRTQIITNVLSPFEELFSDSILRMYKFHRFWSGSKQLKYGDIISIWVKFLIRVIY
jgi:hypothetical protein